MKKPEITILNKQPTEKPVKARRGQVDIVNIFQTIQGEGPFHGYPAVFIRTAGCNLICPGCDTDYTTNRKLYAPSVVLSIVRQLRPDGLVVITGGEPLRQTIHPLICELLQEGFEVQLETNGTYFDRLIPWDKITTVCSPKTPKLHPGIIPYISAYKYVLTNGEVSEEDGLPLSVLGSGIKPYRPDPLNEVPIYIAPADEKNRYKNNLNIKVAIESVLKFGYRLSTQEQKIWGLP